eukprot:SAG22_NODE_225_length_14728_cov_58.742361_3_plen_214_part_00
MAVSLPPIASAAPPRAYVCPACGIEFDAAPALANHRWLAGGGCDSPAPSEAPPSTVEDLAELISELGSTAGAISEDFAGAAAAADDVLDVGESVVLTNLAPAVDEELLVQHCHRFGKLHSAKVAGGQKNGSGEQTNVGIVTFSGAEAAAGAQRCLAGMQGVELLGWKIGVRQLATVVSSHQAHQAGPLPDAVGFLEKLRTSLEHDRPPLAPKP